MTECSTLSFHVMLNVVLQLCGHYSRSLIWYMPSFFLEQQHQQNWYPRTCCENFHQYFMSYYYNWYLFLYQGKDPPTYHHQSLHLPPVPQRFVSRRYRPDQARWRRGLYRRRRSPAVLSARHPELDRGRIVESILAGGSDTERIPE